MKSIQNYPVKSIIAALALSLPGLVSAQEVTVDEATAVTSSGTVSALTDSRITLTADATGDPLFYTYSKGTVYVDELGNPVTASSVKAGVPVTIHYAGVGDKMVANKIVVKRTSAIPNAVSDKTATTTVGTVTEFGQQRIVIRSETSETPLSYTFTKSTTYTDEAGNPVSVETVRSGAPVTVHYTRTGDNLVANRVVIRRTTETTPAGISETTTTTTMGTVSEATPERLVIRSESSPNPVRYRFTKTTTYVDEGGNPVSSKIVKSGLPVTVHYIKDGDTMVARKVVVRKTTQTVPGDPGTARTETVTTTSKGTIGELGGSKLIIKTEKTREPVTYTSNEKTVYVDEAGALVDATSLSSGAPVTVHFTNLGDARVATRVIVHQTTTTTERP